MIPAMVETPEEPASQGADGANLDPEDAPVELDEDGFLVSSGRRRQFPTDLDVWVRWAGAVVVGVAAFETLAYLISGTLQAWATGIGNVPLPRPDGYYSLLLLAGVLLLVLLRRSGLGAAGPGWVRGAACLAAGTGGALVVAQLAGNIGAIVQRSGLAFGQPAAYVAGNVVGGIGGFADVVISAFAAVLAVLLYRWSRAAASTGIEDGGGGVPEGEPEGAGGGAAADGVGGGVEGGVAADPGGGIYESGASTAPDREPRGSIGPAVASLVLGAAVAGACLVAFAVGTRSQLTTGTGLFPTSGTPVVSVPSPNSTVTLGPPNLPPGTTYVCTGTSGSGAIVCTLTLPTEPASPSPAS
jgi:hypothetical protein